MGIRRIISHTLIFWLFSTMTVHAIMNGDLLLDEEYPEVVRLKINKIGLCTGVYISSNVILTSAHCILEGLKNEHSKYEYLDLELPDTQVLDYIVHPLFDKSRKDEDPYDVGMIKVKKKHSFLRLGTRYPAKGNKVTMVGFGLVNPNIPFDHAKRIGMNKILEAQWGQILLETNENDGTGSTLPGDSGGPLIDRCGRIIGIASWSSMDAIKGVKLSKYIDVTCPEVKSFILSW